MPLVEAPVPHLVRGHGLAARRELQRVRVVEDVVPLEIAFRAGRGRRGLDLKLVQQQELDVQACRADGEGW